MDNEMDIAADTDIFRPLASSKVMRYFPKIRRPQYRPPKHYAILFMGTHERLQISGNHDEAYYAQ